jgi:hypothetical protein
MTYENMTKQSCNTHEYHSKAAAARPTLMNISQKKVQQQSLKPEIKPNQFAGISKQFITLGSQHSTSQCCSMPTPKAIGHSTSQNDALITQNKADGADM